MHRVSKFIIPVLVSAAFAVSPSISFAQNSSMQTRLPGLLFTPSQKAGRDLSEISKDNPFPSAKYEKTVMDREELYKAYDEGKYSRVIYGLLRLARDGDARAAETIGLMYRFGQGVPVDNEQAIKWLSRAGEAHRPLAQHHVGVMYFLGEGVQKNMLQASLWVGLAVMNYPDGSNRTRAVEDLKNIKLRLSRLEQVRSEELIEDFIRQHPRPDDTKPETDPAPQTQPDNP